MAGSPQFANYQLPNPGVDGSAFSTGNTGHAVLSGNNTYAAPEYNSPAAAVQHNPGQQYFPPNQSQLKPAGAVPNNYASPAALPQSPPMQQQPSYAGAPGDGYGTYNASSPPPAVQQPATAPVANYSIYAPPNSYAYAQQQQQQAPPAPSTAMQHPPVPPQQPMQQYTQPSGVKYPQVNSSQNVNSYTNSSMMQPTSPPGMGGVPSPIMPNSMQSTYSTSQQQQQQHPQYGYGQPQYAAGGGFPGGPPSGYGPSAHAQPLEGARPVNLLANRNILPPFGIEPPLPQLKHNYKNVVCDPDIFRCTLTAIPRTSGVLDKTRLPFGILIHPFRDLSNLQVLSLKQIVRCRSCRTYINPWITFLDYTKWKCNVCGRNNDLPGEFSYDARTNQLAQPENRPEVTSATVEYIASAEYATRPPQPAVFLFLLDVSFYAAESGYLTSFCRTIKHCLQRIPGDARRSISIIAFDSQLHFFSLSTPPTTGDADETATAQTSDQQQQPTKLDDGGSSPMGRWRELIVGDLDDIFIPDPTGLFANIEENGNDLNRLFDFLPQRFADTRDTGACAGAALQVANKMLHSIGGRVTLFLASMPNIGPGILKQREDPNNRAGSDVKNLSPAIDFYKTLSLKCANQHIGVDLFVMSGQYCDISTLSTICNTSAGAVHFYPGHSTKPPLQPVAHQFIKDLDRYLTRKIGFEAVLRIRCTHGISMKEFHGNFFVRSTDLVVLPVVNPDAGYAFKMEHDEALTEHSAVCFQAALLYTTSYGERRIRVHTLNIPVARGNDEIFAGADQEAIAAFVCRLGTKYANEDRSMDDVRQGIIMCAEDALGAYQTIAKPLSQQLLAPYSLQCLPLYLQAAVKSIPFRAGISTPLDLRAFAMQSIRQSPVSEVLHWIYPALYRIDQALIEILISNQSSNGNRAESEDEPAEQQNSKHHNGGGAQQLSDGDCEESDECDNGGGEHEDDDILACPQVQLSSEFIMADGIYLLEAAMHSILYVRRNVPPILIDRLFGVPNYAAIPPSPGLLGLPPHALPTADGSAPTARARKPNNVQDAFCRFFHALRYDRRLGPTLEVVTEDDRRREIFLQYMHDDRLAKAPSYVETLQSISMNQKSS